MRTPDFCLNNRKASVFQVKKKRQLHWFCHFSMKKTFLPLFDMPVQLQRAWWTNTVSTCSSLGDKWWFPVDESQKSGVQSAKWKWAESHFPFSSNHRSSGSGFLWVLKVLPIPSASYATEWISIQLSCSFCTTFHFWLLNFELWFSAVSPKLHKYVIQMYKGLWL